MNENGVNGSRNAAAWRLGLAAVLMVATVAAAGPPPFESESQFGEWVQTYYEHPAPDALLDGLIYFSTSAFYANGHSNLPMAQFFASAYGDDASRLGILVATLASNPSGNSRLFGARVLWQINSETSRSLLKHASKSWRDKDVQEWLSGSGSQHPRDLLKTPVESPVDLDMLWSMFFATGDRRPIERLVSVLPLRKEGHGLEIVFGGAAEWSLQSNAEHYPKVREILQDLRLQATGTTRQLLDKIVGAAEGKLAPIPSPEPTPIGNPASGLAVHVVVSDSPDYVREWITTAPSHPVFVNRLLSMQRGRTAYIAFIITGYTLDSSSLANLEVDFTLRGPDGTVLFARPGYAKFTHMAQEHAYVMADPALDFSTDPTDGLGTYKIEAVVRDKIAERNAASSETLDVVK